MARCYLLNALLLSGSVVVWAQAGEPTSPPGEGAEAKPAISCVQPPPLVSWQDYNGPLAKTVGVFARKLERKAVQPPRYKPGVKLCSLEPVAKFVLFLHDSTDPVSVLAAGFNAGLDQASNRDPTFGHGGLGYTKRFAANFAGQTASRFFGDFLYPTIFSEDPRYYRMGQGSAKARLFHAMSHTIVAQRDNGKSMFNFSAVARHGKFGGTQQSVPSGQPARRGRGGAKRRLYDTSGHGIRRAARVLARGGSQVQFAIPRRA